jgi:predicted nuclease of restriction endonuclease-like (RecB) superfamily
MAFKGLVSSGRTTLDRLTSPTGITVSDDDLPDDYDALLAELSAAIVQAQVQAKVAVVSELARLHQRLANVTVNADQLGINSDVAYQSDLDREMATDPYLLDFLEIARLPPPAEPCPSEHAIISTLQAYLLGLHTGFALVNCPYRLVTVDAVVLIDLLFFHIPTDRYIAILVNDEGPMDFIVEEVRHVATLLDGAPMGVHNDTIGIASLATEDGPIIRYSYPANTDVATKAAMPDEDLLTVMLSNAVDVGPM